MYRTKIIFFATPKRKMIILSAATVGLYTLFWFYENWRLIRQQENSRIWPYFRALFSFFYAPVLFVKIADSVSAQSGRKNLHPFLLWLLYLFFNAFYFLPDPWWLLAALSFTVLIPVQNAIIYNNRKIDSTYRTSRKIKRSDIIIICIGLALWLAVGRLLYGG